MLLEASVARVIVWSCVFSFAVQYRLGNLLIMLVLSSAARAVRSSTRTARIGVRVLLESSVARVLLRNVAAAECSCVRNCLATRDENTLYSPRTYIPVRFVSVSWCDSSFIYRFFVRRIALRVIL